jgi:predicted helicase
MDQERFIIALQSQFYPNDDIKKIQCLVGNMVSESSVKVEKLRFGADKNKSQVTVRASDVVKDIPPEAYEYLVNGKPAIEWVMDRYQVRLDQDSEILNDPNDWDSNLQGNYISSLLRKVITLSIRTRDIVSKFPDFVYALK